MPPSRNQTKPSLIFDDLVAYLWEKRIETPTYYQLKTLIQEALETVEKELNDIQIGRASCRERVLMPV